MFIQRVLTLCFFLIPLPVLFCKETALLLCFDKNAFPLDHQNHLDLENMASKNLLWAQPVSTDRLIQTSIHTHWCEQNYQCYEVQLTDDSLENAYIVAKDHSVTQEKDLLLTEFSFEKINAQRYYLHYRHFAHPHENLNF